MPGYGTEKCTHINISISAAESAIYNYDLKELVLTLTGQCHILSAAIR